MKANFVREIVILIVDDNANNLRIVGKVLRENNYKIALAKSGSEALHLLENMIPDLILLDIMMPEMDGYELCTRIKQRENLRDIPVIFLTAKDNIEDILKGFNAGGVDFISKPFRQEELLARIKTHIELKISKEIITMQAADLEASNKTKDVLFSIVSHDMMTPMSSLILILDNLINSGKLNDIEFLKKSLDLMQLSAAQTYEQFRNILHWSRNQMNKIDYIPLDFNVNTIIEKTIKVLLPVIRQKELMVTIDCEKDIAGFADVNMLNVVLRNLLTNAIKFSFAGGTIAFTVEKKNEKVIIGISDNGTGMDKETISNILKENSTFTKNGTQGEKGTGLGLSICKSFISINGGELKIESSSGKGSRFSFSIPSKNV